MTQSRSQTLPIQRKIRLLKYFSMAAMMFFLSFIIAIVDPLEKIIDDQVSMRRGSFLFRLWEKPPLDIIQKVYLYNITNAEAFMDGVDKKLKVEEVGPYVYQEFLEHKNPIFHPNGTLSFEPVRHSVLLRDRSVGDPTKDHIITLNLPLLGASSAAAKMSPLASLAVSTLAKTTNSHPVLNLTVHEFLWGYEDRLVQLVNSVLPSFITFERFGLMDRLLDEGQNVVSLNLPKAIELIGQQQKEKTHIILDDSSNMDSAQIDVEYEDVLEKQKLFSGITSMALKLSSLKSESLRDFSIDSWNGSPGLSNWGYDVDDPEKNTRCNTLRGSFDGVLFPKSIMKTDKYKLFRKAFCRTLAIEYSHSGKQYGLDAYWFKFADNVFDDTLDNPETLCYCGKEKKCFKRGLGNITPCYYNIPVSVSLPHFYNSDPSLLNEVEGLHPDKEKHASEIVIQPKLGVIIKAKTRLQLNLMNSETHFNSIVKPFDNLTFPVFWIDMAIEKLTPELEFILTLALNILPIVQIIIILLLGLFGMFYFSIATKNIFSERSSIEKSNLNVNPRKTIKYSAVLPYIKQEIAKFEDRVCESSPKFESV